MDKQPIDFYLLNTPSMKASFPVLCVLCNKAWQQHYQIDIHFNELSIASLFQDALWHYQEASFIPHNLSTQEIQIRDYPSLKQNGNLLINCTANLSLPIRNYQRILQLIPNDERFKKSLRPVFRLAQQQGLNIKTHSINVNMS